MRNPFLDFVVLFEGAGGQYAPSPFLQQASGEIFKKNVNGFFSTSDICFMFATKQICPDASR
jgi:hypothetical protein